jgi:hypothetical protein
MFRHVIVALAKTVILTSFTYLFGICEKIIKERGR